MKTKGYSEQVHNKYIQVKTNHGGIFLTFELNSFFLNSPYKRKLFITTKAIQVLVNFQAENVRCQDQNSEVEFIVNIFIAAFQFHSSSF